MNTNEKKIAVKVVRPALKMTSPLVKGRVMSKLNVSSHSESSVNSSESVDDASRRQQIRDFLDSKKRGDRLDSVMEDNEKTVKLKDYLISNGVAMKLTNTEVSFQKNHNEYMPINYSDIFPGRLIYANAEMINGKPEPVVFSCPDKIGKVTVVLDFFTGKISSKRGVKAEKDAIKDAISELLYTAIKEGNIPPADVQQNISVSSNAKKIAADMGCSVEYMNVNANLSVSVSNSTEKFYSVENLYQKYFSVSIEFEDDDITNFLGKGVTVDDLRKAYNEQDKPLAYIASVTYGRTGYFTKEFSSSDFTFKSSEGGGYGETVKAHTSQEISESSTEYTGFAKVLGGHPSVAGNAISQGLVVHKGDTSKYSLFLQAMEDKEAMVVSMNNQGVPISYVVKYLASRKTISNQDTGKYIDTKYEPLVNRLQIHMQAADRKELTFLGGTKCIHAIIDYDYFYVDPNTAELCPSKNGHGQIDHYWQNRGDDWNVCLELPKNCYIKNNTVRLEFKSRKAASKGLDEWKHCSNGSLNVSRGILKVKLVGSYYSHSVTCGGKVEDGFAKFPE